MLISATPIESAEGGLVGVGVSQLVSKTSIKALIE
jgi:hypothetical protein